MLKHLAGILLFFLVVTVECFGQDTDAGPGYQTILMNNPAFSGISGDGSLRLSYFNYFPGNNYNLHSVYFSYDSYFPILHGGAGFYISDDYLGGIVNDLRGGFSYSYFLQAGKDLFINAGLSGSLYHRGYNFNKAVFPDQIDALGGISFPSTDMRNSSGKTSFDAGVGFLLISGKFFGGFAVNHLAEPDISGTGFNSDRLKRKIILHLSRDFTLNNVRNLIIRPQVYIGYQKDLLNAAAGAVLESKYLSVNVLLLGDNVRNINMQTGFSLKSNRVCIFYNYRFNIASGNSLMPFSLLHQTGLAFSLNDVDKRNLIKTINFPKL